MYKWIQPLFVVACLLGACQPLEPATSLPPADQPSLATESPVTGEANNPTLAPEVATKVWATESAFMTEIAPSGLPFDAPPPARLEVGDVSQTAGVGTFCWSGGCADMIGVPTPLTPLTTTSPFTANLVLPLAEAPSELFLTVAAVTEADKMQGPADRLWWVPPQVAGRGEQRALPKQKEQAIALTLEPGLYLLQVGAWFTGQGDVQYGFLIAVVE